MASYRLFLCDMKCRVEYIGTQEIQEKIIHAAYYNDYWNGAEIYARKVE